MSKSSYSGKVFTVLEHKLTKLDQIKHDKDLLTKESWFSREKKKLDFKDDMKILMSIGSSSMNKEIFLAASKPENLDTIPSIFPISDCKVKKYVINHVDNFVNLSVLI